METNEPSQLIKPSLVRIEVVAVGELNSIQQGSEGNIVFVYEEKIIYFIIP